MSGLYVQQEAPQGDGWAEIAELLTAYPTKSALAEHSRGTLRSGAFLLPPDDRWQPTLGRFDCPDSLTARSLRCGHLYQQLLHQNR